jgi:hypothetical protein
MSATALQTVVPSSPVAYDELCQRLRAIVQEATPEGATVAVVSKGDPQLVELEDRIGWHFPLDAEGRYAGFHPKSAEDAVDHLDALRGAGAQFLCLPATAFWWLNHYQGLAVWLNEHCQLVAHEFTTCLIYSLHPSPETKMLPREPQGAAIARARVLLDSLLPEGALVFVVGPGTDGLSAPGREIEALGANQADGLRRLAAFQADRPTFVLMPASLPDARLDPGFESFISGRLDPIAHREHLCNLFRLRSGSGGTVMSQLDQKTIVAHRLSDEELNGPRARKLWKRLESLGLCDRVEESNSVGANNSRRHAKGKGGGGDRHNP